MDRPTPEPPFPDALRTGRRFITPCCTAATFEFSVGGVLLLATRVAGHGWFPAEPGRIESIGERGTFIEADGIEHRVPGRPEQGGH